LLLKSVAGDTSRVLYAEVERLAENRCREGQHFESLSYAKRDAVENASSPSVSDSTQLADTAGTLLIASGLEPIGYREFESSRPPYV
jgi:hypothetical protein